MSKCNKMLSQLIRFPSLSIHGLLIQNIYLVHVYLLTKIWTQCVQIRPTIMVPSAPNSNPAFLKAAGIAKIPVPKLDLSKCASEPIVELGLSISRCSNGL